MKLHLIKTKKQKQVGIHPAVVRPVSSSDAALSHFPDAGLSTEICVHVKVFSCKRHRAVSLESLTQYLDSKRRVRLD